MRMSAGKDERSRFVERRGFVTPWRFQAAQFETAELAEAFAKKLKPVKGAKFAVVTWAKAWHEELDESAFKDYPRLTIAA
jgi:hypothetical protein